MHLNWGEVLDFGAGVLIQWGAYLKIQKRAAGWMISLIAILYWICRAKGMDLNSQAFWHMCSFLMASYGFFMWRKAANK